jgi:hypothetical protein
MAECPVRNECPHDCNPINNPCWHHQKMIDQNKILDILNSDLTKNIDNLLKVISYVEKKLEKVKQVLAENADYRDQIRFLTGQRCGREYELIKPEVLRELEYTVGRKDDV